MDLLISTEKDEVRKVVWSLDPDKDPGPNGLKTSYYRNLWDIIKETHAKCFNMLRNPIR
jgi:hypothetical protein